jgi:3-isopropylmalate dehydrogenase
MRYVGGLWRRVFAEVGAEYPEVEQDAMYVDAMAMDLLRRPERYRVVVASNLFGDVVSDLAAEVTGGLGMAPSANLHPGRHALFEPVHGSAPDIAGTGRANPIGAIRCVALLLDHFGHRAAASRVESAVAAALATGRCTPDAGGSLSTSEAGAWIADHLSALGGTAGAASTPLS